MAFSKMKLMPATPTESQCSFSQLLKAKKLIREHSHIDDDDYIGVEDDADIGGEDDDYIGGEDDDYIGGEDDDDADNKFSYPAPCRGATQRCHALLLDSHPPSLILMMLMMILKIIQIMMMMLVAALPVVVVRYHW